MAVTPTTPFRIPADIKRSAAALARSNGESLTDVVVRALHDYVDAATDGGADRWDYVDVELLGRTYMARVDRRDRTITIYGGRTDLPDEQRGHTPDLFEHAMALVAEQLPGTLRAFRREHVPAATVTATVASLLAVGDGRIGDVPQLTPLLGAVFHNTDPGEVEWAVQRLHDTALDTGWLTDRIAEALNIIERR